MKGKSLYLSHLAWRKLTVHSNRTMEYAAVEDLYSPPLHRINQVVRHRATYPGEPVPPVPAILLKYALPPDELLAKARSDLEDLIDKASVKKGKIVLGFVE